MRKRNSSLFFPVSLYGVKEEQLRKIYKDLLTLQPLKNHIFRLFSLSSLRSYVILSSLLHWTKLFKITETSIYSSLLKLLIEKSSVFRILSLNSSLSSTLNLISNQLQLRYNNAEQLSKQISFYHSNKIKSSKAFNFYTSNSPARFTNQFLWAKSLLSSKKAKMMPNFGF